MPISDLDRQLLLVQSVGDIDPANGDPVTPTTQGVTGLVFSNIGRLWLKYSAKAQIDPNLRDLYVFRDALDLVIGRLAELVDISTNNGQVSLRLSQRVQVRRQQRDAIEADIQRFESYLARQSGPSVAAIAITSPISPPAPGDRPTKSPFFPDASSPEYSGSPYWRGRRAGP